MMTQRATRIWEECQAWPEEERAELADRLLLSLETEEEIQSAWDREIADRLQSLDNGTEQCVSSEEFHRTLRNSIDANRLSSQSSG